MFEAFKQGQALTMIDWFQALQHTPFGSSFKDANARCHIKMFQEASWLEMKRSLMEGYDSIGCIGMRCFESGTELCHYVATWYEADRFYILDPGVGGVGIHNGSADTLEQAVTTCGLAARRDVRQCWGAVMTTRSPVSGSYT
jgi:hypothetical protein